MIRSLVFIVKLSVMRSVAGKILPSLSSVRTYTVPSASTCHPTVEDVSNTGRNACTRFFMYAANPSVARLAYIVL